MKKSLIALLGMIFLGASQVYAQGTNELKIVVNPDPININVGEEIQINAKVVNADGVVQPDTVLFFSRSPRSLSVSREGYAKALKPGTSNVMVFKPAQGESPSIRTTIEVMVTYPKLEKLVFTESTSEMYEGTSFLTSTVIYDEMDFLRDDLEITDFRSSKPDVAQINRYGKINAKKPGKTTISATYDGITTSFDLRVEENPVRSVELSVDKESARTGDVLHLTAIAKDRKDREVEDAPIEYSFTSVPDDHRGQGASAQIEQDGRFVANHPGLYTIIARNAGSVDEVTVRIEPRNVGRDISVAGFGAVSDVYTSDLWVWEGVDGRDYAVTGTWSAKGDALFWDVTDPSNMHIIDTVTVDARTVNDVKVSEDGRIAVISREGASNRKNGLVILDVSDPSDVKILSRFDDGLSGGVHNVFIDKGYVYAINNGRKYDIINIKDPANPFRVSEFELDTPGHSVHDVWVVDGIAYSSNWTDGVVAVDVGGNATPDMPGAGGSPENPVKLGSYTYPSGWNHAAFPFKSKSADKFYIAAGDEAFPNGEAAGYIHFFDLSSWENGQEVARYEVPEAGTHNIWIQDDVMYVAYYQGGLRIVDVSGELMGNLYDQGREIARYLPKDPDGKIPNSPQAWGPQPYKDLIFVSDMNSGLWALKLSPPNTASAQ